MWWPFKRKRELVREAKEHVKIIEEREKTIDYLTEERSHHTWVIDALEKTIRIQKVCIEQMERNSLAAREKEPTDLK